MASFIANRNEDSQRRRAARAPASTGTGAFIHREIFHFLPHKVETFHTRLLKPDPIIADSRSMRGCYSFDIYRRTTDPTPKRGEPWDASSDHEIVESPFLATENKPSATADSRPEKDRVEALPKDEKSIPSPDSPHQFIALGRWEDRQAYERFFYARNVQKFFCSIMSRKVFKSFPILTMWSKRNGHHVPFDPSLVRQPESPPEETSTKSEKRETRPTSISGGHFVMTRKRCMPPTKNEAQEDQDGLQRALNMLKTLAQHALEEEEGCHVYDVCVTGNENFNANEVLEIAVWDSKEAFIRHSGSWRWTETQMLLLNLFDLTKDELLFWETPQAS